MKPFGGPAWVWVDAESMRRIAWILQQLLGWHPRIPRYMCVLLWILFMASHSSKCCEVGWQLHFILSLRCRRRFACIQYGGSLASRSHGDMAFFLLLWACCYEYSSMPAQGSSRRAARLGSAHKWLPICQIFNNQYYIHIFQHHIRDTITLNVNLIKNRVYVTLSRRVLLRRLKINIKNNNNSNNDITINLIVIYIILTFLKVYNKVNNKSIIIN